MKVPAKVDYACRALIELGLHWPNTAPLQISNISKRQSIPSNYLIHILISLKQSGLVESARGKRGGYFLTKSPAEIYLWDIVNNFGGSHLFESPKAVGRGWSISELIWKDIDDDVIKKMKMMTLSSLCERIRTQNKTVLYDI